MKKSIQSLSLKHWRKLLVILCAIGMIIAGVLIGLDTIKKKEVSAHPTNTIKLDEGGSKEYELPVDADQLQEQALRDLTPQFDDYVQGTDAVPILEKNSIDAFGSPTGFIGGTHRAVDCNIIGVEKTQAGNYFILFQISGNTTGGIIRTTVYSKDGKELDSNSIGTRHNNNLRINTGIFNAENNNFLVMGQDESFYKYTVTESGNTASIQRTQCSVTGRPGTTLKSINITIVNELNKNTNGVLLTGRTLPYGSDSSSGAYKKRRSIVRMSMEGWLSGSFTGSADYQYSLQSLLLEEDLNMTPGSYAYIEGPTYIVNGYTVGVVNYYDTNFKRSDILQIFSNEDIIDTEVSDNGGVYPKVVKKRVYHHLDLGTIRENYRNGKTIAYTVVENLCDDDFVYFTADDGISCELIRVSLNTYQDEVVKTYPTGVALNFYKNSDGTISYYGSTPKLSGEFQSNYYPVNPVSGSHYFISGTMNGISNSPEDLNIKSLRAFEVDGVIAANFALEGQNNKLFVAGRSYDYTKFPTSKYMIDEQAPNYTRTMNEDERSSASMAFIGTLDIKDDYSPVVKKAPDISIDLEDPVIRTPSDSGYRGWSTLDRWLITGSKSGVVSDANAIKVYDHFDSNDPSLAGTAAEREEWLQKRINRNPNDITAAIEWNKLGFDKSIAGAQLVTYFVTDTQGQPAVTSRWVNKKTGQTEEADDFALDAQNFHIPLNGIDSAIPDADKFKEFAKTMAWNKKDIAIDEDGTDSSKLSSKVTVDADQLKALREAKVAKPYPVDVTYKPKLGVEIVNRVWVFLTTKNTVPNSETNPAMTPQDTNGVVYYADDYELPFRMRGSHTANDVLARGNVRVYDYYDADHETSAELPTLADASKNANKLVVENLSVINNATEPGKVTPSIRYEWDGTIDANHKDGSIAGNETRGYLDVTLTGNILLHVRQVVLDASDEIVVPKKGYVEINNRLSNGGLPTLDTNYQAQLVVGSGKLTDHPSFTDIGLSVEHLPDNADEVLFSTVIPEFYEYVGYYSTTEQADSQGASHQGQTNYVSGDLALLKSTLNNEEEFWITLYLKPTEDDQGEAKAPQPYSWDYKKNDLGKIKTN